MYSCFLLFILYTKASFFILSKVYVVKEYEFDKTDIHEIDYLIDDVIKHCRKNYFHTFEYRLVYDINFTIISNNEEVDLIVTHRSMEFKTEFYGLNKKIKNARRNGFIFNQINNFKIEIYSNLSYINIHYHLRLGGPPLHRQFFMKLLKIVIIFKPIVIICIILFILHVANGIYIITQVYLHEYIYKTSIIICIFVKISLIFLIFV